MAFLPSRKPEKPQSSVGLVAKNKIMNNPARNVDRPAGGSHILDDRIVAAVAAAVLVSSSSSNSSGSSSIGK
jgi:hypothetical protein